MSSNTNYTNTNYNTPQAINYIDPLPTSISTPISNQKYDEDDIYNELLKQALLKKYQKINQKNNVNRPNSNYLSNNNINNINPNMFKLKSISSAGSRRNKKNISALSKSYNNQNKNIYDESENNIINTNSNCNNKKFSSDRLKGFSNNDLNNYYKESSNTANNCAKYKKIYKDNICGSGDMGRGNFNINLNGYFENNGVNGFSDRYDSRPKTRKSFDYNILCNSSSNNNNNINLNNNVNNSNNSNNIFRKFNKYYQGNQFNLYNKNNIKINNINNEYANTDSNTNNINNNNLNQKNKYKNLVIYNPLQICNNTQESNSNTNPLENDDNPSYRNNKTQGNYIENHNYYLDSNRKNNKNGMSFDKYCAILKHKIDVLKFDIAKYKKDKFNLVQFINDNIDMKAINTINKLEGEVNGYKNAVLKYKKNCEDLTKEIVVIQHQINKFKNSKC